MTPDLIAKICDCIRAGNYAKTACAVNSIDQTTYYRWIKQGKEDHDNGLDSLFCELCDGIERAKAEAEIFYVNVIKTAADNGSLEAAKFWLERVRPEGYGQRQKIEVNQSFDELIQAFRAIK